MNQSNRLVCGRCGKARGNHSAVSLMCPMGRKHAILGYTNFHKVNDFIPKYNRKEKRVGK